MSDTKQPSASDGPASVEIPLDNVSQHSIGRKSSTSSASTSSFENVITAKPDNVENVVEDESEPLDPATVEVEELEPKAAPRGALTFKTTSLDDPTYYAQTTSSSNSPSLKATTRSQGRTPTKMNITYEDRDPENVNEIVKVPILLFIHNLSYCITSLSMFIHLPCLCRHFCSYVQTYLYFSFTNVTPRRITISFDLFIIP